MSSQEAAVSHDGDATVPTGPLRLVPLDTHETSWAPSSAKLAMHATLDACIVPDANGAARVDTAHVVVLDNFFSEAERSELLDFITEPGWDHMRGPPPGKWQRSTRDRTDAAPTWGLTGTWLQRLATEKLRARLEVQSRLVALYPDYLIAHMPSQDIQMQQAGAAASEEADEAVEEEAEAEGGDGMEEDDPQPARGQEEDESASKDDGDGDTAPVVSHDGDEEGREVGTRVGGATVDCNQFVANAAVHGDSYSWHVDADPSTLPYPSPWTLEYGQYVNREPGRPLFVSLLLYLNPIWERNWDAETLFLDTPSDCGVVVRPKPYRAVLMDQDVLHRLSAPSASAGGRARYSLVWKLVFVPRRPGQRVSLARREWGRPAAFGSAALLERVVAGLQSGSGRGGRTGAGEAGGPDCGSGRGGGAGLGGVGGDGAGGGGSPEGGGRDACGQQTAQAHQQDGAATRAATGTVDLGGPAGRAPASGPGEMLSPQQQLSQHQHQALEAAATGGPAAGDTAPLKPMSAAAKKRKRRAEVALRKKLKVAAGNGGPGEADEVDAANPEPAAVAASVGPATEDQSAGSAAAGVVSGDSSSSEGAAHETSSSEQAGPTAAVAQGKAPGDWPGRLSGSATPATTRGEQPHRRAAAAAAAAAGKGAAGPVAPPGQGKRKGKRGGVRAKRKKELAAARAAAAQPAVPIGPWASRWGPPPRPLSNLHAQTQQFNQPPAGGTAQAQGQEQQQGQAQGQALHVLEMHAQQQQQQQQREASVVGSANHPSAGGKEAETAGPTHAVEGANGDAAGSGPAQKGLHEQISGGAGGSATKLRKSTRGGVRQRNKKAAAAAAAAAATAAAAVALLPAMDHSGGC